jgi:hypothetical protein
MIWVMRGPRETFGHDQNVSHLNCGDRFSGICACKNLSTAYLKCILLIIYQSYFDKASFKMNSMLLIHFGPIVLTLSIF